MSHSTTHALSTRLFIQAALTGLLAPTAAGGSSWLVLTLAVAAGAVAVALLVRNSPANAKRMVIGFEGVALVVGGLGLAGGHYIPGTIIGVITLITALNLPAGAAVATSSDEQWVPPQADDQAPSPYGPPPSEQPAPQPQAAPVGAAPAIDNPYAPPVPTAAVPTWVPPQAMPLEAPVPMQMTAAVEATAPMHMQAPAPAPAAVESPAPAAVEPPVAAPLRPEDIPPAPRSLTILPGK